MNIRWKGLSWSLMLVKRPDWTSLSNSSTAGAFSSLLRGSGNNLVGHAELFPAGRFVAGIVGATAVTSVAATVAAMNAKSRFDDRKAKLGTEEAAEEMSQNTTAVVEASDVSVTRPISV
ncbi:hypothetical protein [Streptomyces europaeiscabiei]|uniref:hypothetical protein n=1 Tax=Streptomyces europaeiscabiei TaxID=146819 RepID=UPI0029AD8458|nr:hypothetical protein [Streptomyces europaeiscabiei]MDX3589363.1 hypothetical protein [Streptomyces europaeiscabiei]